MKKRLLSLLLVLCMSVSLLSGISFAADSEEEIYYVTGIVVANKYNSISTDSTGKPFYYVDYDRDGKWDNVVYDYNGEVLSHAELITEISPTGTDETRIMYQRKDENTGESEWYSLFLPDTSLSDDMLGCLVDVSFTYVLEGATTKISVIDLALNESTVVYEVPASDIEIYPNGTSRSTTAIKPKIVFTTEDGEEKTIYAPAGTARVSENHVYDGACFINSNLFYSFTAQPRGDLEGCCELVCDARNPFIRNMGESVPTTYRLISIDGGETISYIMTNPYYSMGYITSYNPSQGLIGSNALGSNTDLDYVEVYDGIAKGDFVIATAKDGKAILHPTETVVGAVETYSGNTVVINGVSYTGSQELLWETDSNSLADFYSSAAGRSLMRGATYHVYDNMLLAVNESAPYPTDLSDFAVVLRSAQDEETGTATVKLGLTDGSEATYTVNYFVDKTGRSYNAEEDDFSPEFANNAKVGCIVSYSVADGKVELVEEEIFQATYHAVKDGGMVYNGTQLWATDDSLVFLLYTTSSSSRNVRFKLYKIADMADRSSAAIPVYTEGDNYKDLNGAAVMKTSRSSSDILLASMTYGVGTPSMLSAGDEVGYIVDSVVEYDGATRKNCLNVSLIDMETKALLTGKYMDVKTANLVGAPGTVQEGSAKYAIGSIAQHAHDGEKFTALDVNKLGSIAHQQISYNPTAWGNEAIGFFRVSIREANERRISFYPYGATAAADADGTIDDSALLTVSVDEYEFDSVAISGKEPIGTEIATISKFDEVKATDYNAIIEVDSTGRIRKVFSIHSFPAPPVPPADEDESVWSFDDVSELLSITVDGVTTTYEVETVTGAVETYFANTVTIGGVTYTAAQCFLDEWGFDSIAEFYYSSAGRGLLRGGAYFVYDGKIVAINENAPIDTSNYAVVLKSSADESTGEAIVKLGCTDGSEATYTVGCYTDLGGYYYDPEEDSSAIWEFANNAMVGNLVSYEVRSGKLELTAESLLQYGSANIRGGELNVYDSSYAPAEGALAFLLYTTSNYSRNIRFKLYNVETLNAVSNSSIPVYTEGSNYKELSGVSSITKNDSVSLCALTYGTSVPTFPGDLSQSGTVTTPEGDPEYAVVLKSSMDEDAGEAIVKLGLVDGSEATYTVGYFTDRGGRTYDSAEDDSFAYEFANNAKVGYIVSFKVRSDGTAALTEEAIFNYNRATVKDGGMVYDGKSLWAIEESVMFLLYTPSATSRNVRFKVCDLYNMADRSSAAIPVYTEGSNYKDLNGSAVLASDSDITFASMTYGVGTPSNLTDGAAVGYITSSVVEYDAATRKNYLEVSLIDLESRKLLSGKYTGVKTADLVGAPGTIQEGTAKYAIGSIAQFAYDGKNFTALDVNQLGSIAHQNVLYDPSNMGNEAIGFFKVSIAEANDRRISFYSYGETALPDWDSIDTSALTTVSVDSARFQSVAILNGIPSGTEIATLDPNREVWGTDYNAIIEVNSSGRIVKVFSFHEMLLGDVNVDGKVDVRDAALLFQHSMLPDMYPIHYTGTVDFNYDGKITIEDAVLLFQHSMLPDQYPIN